MKLLEAVLWVVIIVYMLFIWMNLLKWSSTGFNDYIKKIKIDSEKISLYNYSLNFIQTISTGSKWYISLTGNQYYTGNSWTYYYKCDLYTWTLIKSETKYEWVFCMFKFDKEEIYNYRIIKSL